MKHNRGRKLIVPNISTTMNYKPDKTLVRALGKAWQWQKLLDEGTLTSAQAIAKKYKMNRVDVSRILRMNWLSPKIKRSILDGTAPRTMNMLMFKKTWPNVWEDQLRFFGFQR